MGCAALNPTSPTVVPSHMDESTPPVLDGLFFLPSLLCMDGACHGDRSHFKLFTWLRDPT